HDVRRSDSLKGTCRRTATSGADAAMGFPRLPQAACAALPDIPSHGGSGGDGDHREKGSLGGVRAQTPRGPLDVRVGLVVGADGRHSVVRARAGLKVTDLGAPM